MVEISDSAYAVTVDIVQKKRKDVQLAKEWLEIVGTQPALDNWHRTKDELAAMERIMMNLGLDC